MDYPVLECCVDSVVSAIHAQEGGANRLELCGNLIIGGTTPTMGLFHQIKANTTIKVHALIRPRFGDFLYDEFEMNIMEEEISALRKEGVDGVVIGCLTKDGELDYDKMARLIEKADGANITLHRAFDVCRDPFEALEMCKKLGISTILTSGQKNHVLEGKALLKELCEHTEGKVEIMPGAGVNAEVIEKLLPDLPVKCFHMSGKKTLDSQMRYRKEGVSMGLESLSEFEIWETQTQEIAKARAVMQTLLERKGIAWTA